MTKSSTDTKANAPPERVVAYIDGFNLYFGICDRLLRQYLWLDVHKLAKKLAFPNQIVGVTKYFTARVKGAKEGDSKRFAAEQDAKRKRQTTYLDALSTVPQIVKFEGNYYDNLVKCNGCGRTWHDQEEKMTDVAIATEMLADAYLDLCDTFLLVSGDSDLVPPVKKILTTFPEKKIIAVFPPDRYSADLDQAASGRRYIEKGHLKKSQLPLEIPVGSHKLKKPDTWV